MMLNKQNRNLVNKEMKNKVNRVTFSKYSTLEQLKYKSIGIACNLSVKLHSHPSSVSDKLWRSATKYDNACTQRDTCIKTRNKQTGAIIDCEEYSLYTCFVIGNNLRIYGYVRILENGEKL